MRLDFYFFLFTHYFHELVIYNVLCVRMILSTRQKVPYDCNINK